MFLYHKTIKQTETVIQAISGSFSEPKKSEVVLLKNSILELLTIDENSLKSIVLIKKEVFSSIKKIQSFRFSGNKKDNIIVTSDSGKLVVLEADVNNNTFTVIHDIAFSKSGSRSIVPSDYIACDPKGRAIMIAALEKTKYVFCFNTDNETKQISISSPIEASTNNTVTFDLISIENGYNNPIFAALETKLDYSDENNTIYTGKLNKIVTIYEMDIGLNQVVKRFSFETDASATKLIPINISQTSINNKKEKNILINDTNQSTQLIGVIICCEGFIILKVLNSVLGMKLDTTVRLPRDCDDSFICFLPTRLESKFKKCIITNQVIFKVEAEVLILLQTDLGDLMKFKVEFADADNILGVVLEYFDSISSSKSLCIMRNGILFSATESGNK